MGSNAGVPDPRGAFTIKPRLADPLTGTVVCYDGYPINILINFNRCTDLRLGAEQPDADEMYCDEDEVVVLTDASYIKTLTLVGAGRGVAPHPSGSGAPISCQKPRVTGCAEIWADGAFLGNVPVAALDLDAAGGVGPADIALWLDDSFHPTYVSRSDYDFNGRINPADLSLLLDAALDGSSTQSCTAYCH